MDNKLVDNKLADNNQSNPSEVVRCTRCGNRGHVDSECRTKICTYCEKFGHLAEVCRLDPNNVQCFYCKKKGHKVDTCYSLQRRIREQNRPAYCPFCKKEGHSMDDCGELKRHYCSSCGEKGHYNRYCSSEYIFRR